MYAHPVLQRPSYLIQAESDLNFSAILLLGLALVFATRTITITPADPEGLRAVFCPDSVAIDIPRALDQDLGTGRGAGEQDRGERQGHDS